MHTLVWVAAAVGASSSAGAQAPGGVVVEGVAFDSLAGRPLAGATVRTSRGAEAVTDARGRFVLEGLIPGEHRLEVSHDDVSGWLLGYASVGLSVSAGARIRHDLGIPSARSLLESLCARTDVALVGGVAQDLLTLVPLPGAEVRLAAPSGRTGGQIRFADAGGAYHFCVQETDDVRVEAVLGTTESRSVRVRVRPGSVAQRDLFVPATRPARIEGSVVEEGTGAPIGDVVIRIDGSRTRTLTDSRGRFVLAGVPPGDLTLVAEHIAYGEGRGQVMVGVQDTLDVEIALSPVAIPLAEIEVVVRSRARPRRFVQATRFDGMTRERIEAILPSARSVPDLIERANVPGLHVQRVNYVDATTGIPTPGVCIEVGRRRSLNQTVCMGMVAVYVNDVKMAAPEEFLLDLDPASIDRFQILSPLEAVVRYGGMDARNGVLLLYLR